MWYNSKLNDEAHTFYQPIQSYKSCIQKVVLLIRQRGDLSWDPLSFLWSLHLMVSTLLNFYFEYVFITHARATQNDAISLVHLTRQQAQFNPSVVCNHIIDHSLANPCQTPLLCHPVFKLLFQSPFYFFIPPPPLK